MQFVPLKSALTKPTFEVEVADLVEIKKRGVFIGRAVLGWAAGINIEGMGLVSGDGESRIGNARRLTKIVVVNRKCASNLMSSELLTR